VRVTLGAGADQAMLSVTVEDDGPGIADDVRPWLFVPDPETGRAKGLALKLVQEIAAAHGGGVVVKSSTDAGHRGTTITLWLPSARS
jgi:two-component system C4-dicarboxylate transport sensor histidine kinase DctB